VDGHLDERNQAFLTLDFGQGPLDFEIDTGFAGTLLVGEELFDSAQATLAGYVEADLASDRSYVYPCFFVEFPWHGETVRVQVLIGPGTECLLGTEFLNPHRLEIDYGERAVHLIRNPSW
jgi:predicted aspartyl protease